MQSWIVVQTALTKETQVERSLALEGYATFAPLSVRDVAISRHTKARRLVYSVLIPRIVFALAPEDIDLSKIRHASQLHRNASGLALSIPDSQMVRFRHTHQAWLENETKLYRAYIRGLERKGKKPKKIEPSVLGWVEAMKQLGDELFGETKEAA